MPKKEILSSRERVRLALEHRETDRIPVAMVCSGINPPAHRALENYLSRNRGLSVHEYLKPLIDIKGVAPEYIGPPLEKGFDIWGVHRKPVSYGSGSYSEIDYYPLSNAESIDDLDKHNFPSTEWFDYSVIPERIAAAQSDGEYCLMITNGNVFETSWYMRGFQQMLIDFILNGELAYEIMTRVTDFYVEHFRRILHVAKEGIDLAFTADDIGDQRGLLISLEMWEDFIKPHHKRLNDVIHEFGVKVIYHSDGSVMEAVPGLIDMGIDILQALQFSADGMDPFELKQRYGDNLCFEGGVSVQTTLPFGNPEDVRQEVEDLITILGRNGGYILGPSHAIQAGTPPENIVAMFDTAKTFYPFS
jgi:uroporphyrinogen decarboxylase